MLALQAGSNIATALEFFIYDIFKIFALLIVITHFMSALRFYLPIEKLMEKYVEDFVWKIKSDKINKAEKTKMPLWKILILITKEAFDIIKKVAFYILLGIGLGAFIHGFVPEGFFEQYLKQAGVFGVPLAVILGVPMYANASGVIPIIQSLVDKGIPFGYCFSLYDGCSRAFFARSTNFEKGIKMAIAWCVFWDSNNRNNSHRIHVQFSDIDCFLEFQSYLQSSMVRSGHL